MRLIEEPDQPFSINMLPMLDVIFAILAFLIVSTLFLTRSESLPVNLPTATTGEISQQDQINITIKTQGLIFLNKTPITLDDIIPSIKELINSQPNSIIIINADEEVNHGKVIAVMDLLRTIPQAKIAIAVTSDVNN